LDLPDGARVGDMGPREIGCRLFLRGQPIRKPFTRSWRVRHCHMTLSMLALAFVACLWARLLEAPGEGSFSKTNKMSLSASA
jgi:hypothetical protein